MAVNCESTSFVSIETASTSNESRSSLHTEQKKTTQQRPGARFLEAYPNKVFLLSKAIGLVENDFVVAKAPR